MEEALEIECAWRSEVVQVSMPAQATVKELQDEVIRRTQILEPKLIGLKPKSPPEALLSEALPLRGGKRKVTILGQPASLAVEVAPPPEADAVVNDLDVVGPERTHEEREAELSGDPRRLARAAASAARRGARGGGGGGGRRGPWHPPPISRRVEERMEVDGEEPMAGRGGEEGEGAERDWEGGGTRQRLYSDGSDDEMGYREPERPPRPLRSGPPPPAAAASSSGTAAGALPSKEELAKLAAVDAEDAPLDTIYEFFYPDVALRPAAFRGGYEEAVAESRRRGLLLLFYMHREGEPEHERFMRECLAERFVLFFKHLGDQAPACPYLAPPRPHPSQTVRRFGRRAPWLTDAMSRPSIYAIAHTGSLASVVDLVHGEGLSGAALADRLGELHDTRSFLVAEAPITEAELMRREQDEAFARALEEDRRREEERAAAERRREEERAAAERAEAEAEEARKREEEEEDAYQAHLQRLRHNIPQEPPRTEADVCEVRIMLPSGDRMGRRFRASDRLQSIVDYIRCFTAIDRRRPVRLARNFPRVVYSDMDLTLAAAGVPLARPEFCP